jgi:hypothetical protein
MHHLLALGWKLRSVLLAAVVVLGGLGWVQRGTILTWYYLERLARCAEGDDEPWIGRVTALDHAATPGLLRALAKEDTTLCPRVERCLANLVQAWGPTDPRTVGVVVHAAKGFANLPVPGRCAGLRVAGCAVEPLKQSPPQQLSVALIALLRQATRDADESVRGAGLMLAEKSPGTLSAEHFQACAELAKLGLKDGHAENRAQAVRVAARAGSGLTAAVVAALRDPSADVRREALRAVGPWDDAVSTDDLLQWLHDPEPPVRRACEEVLRMNRHLAESHIEMGRLLTDARPAVRLRVLQFLQGNTDLDSGVWLRRLSHDASPAVRAATVRAATEAAYSDLADRIEQIAQQDPSATVRQLAEFYLSHRAN